MQIEGSTNTYIQSFFPHAISLWNSLPIDVCQLSGCQLSPDSLIQGLSEHHPAQMFSICSAGIAVPSSTVFGFHFICVIDSSCVLQVSETWTSDEKSIIGMLVFFMCSHYFVISVIKHKCR